MSTNRKKNNYINNENFTKECINYIEEYKTKLFEETTVKLEYTENGIIGKPKKGTPEKIKYDLFNRENRPTINRYIAECIILLSKKVSCMPAFVNYPYRDEMVSDAIEICVKYFHNFNPNAVSKRTGEKTAGAFGYFQQFIARRMFKRRAEELLQMYTKQKYIAQTANDFSETAEYDEPEVVDSIKAIVQEMSGDDWIEYDKKIAEKKRLLDEDKLIPELEEIKELEEFIKITSPLSEHLI